MCSQIETQEIAVLKKLFRNALNPKAHLIEAMAQPPSRTIQAGSDVFPTRTAQLVSNLNSSQFEIFKEMLLGDRGYPAPNVTMRRLFNAVLDTNTGLIVLPGGEMEESSLPVGMCYTDTRRPELPQEVRIAASKKITKKVVHVFHRSCGAYGHFLIDGLCSLALLRETIKSEGLKILVPKFLPKWAVDVLGDLGFPPKQLIVAKGTVLVKDMTICSMLGLTNCTSPSRDIISKLRDFTGAKQGAVPSRKIYLSREGAYSPRTVKNENDVVAEFQAHGFELIHPASLSFRQQIELFSEAKVIAGNHGSAFANMVFAPPGAQIIDLMPESWVGYWGDSGIVERWLLNLTAVCDHNYTVVLSPSEMIGGPYQVNAPSVLAPIVAETDLKSVRSVLAALD